MKVRVAYGADTIEIIDSIPEGESQTARRLSGHIKDLQYAPAVMQGPVTLHHVATSAELRALLSRLADHAERDDLWPLIHIESHGDTDGIRLANGDYVRWPDLQPMLLRLNKATRNHLFTVMAACSGFHGIKAMLSATENVASLRLLVGPAEETTSGNLEDAMQFFYGALLKTGNVVGAVAEAQRHEPTFRGYSAEEAFIAGWRKTLEEHPVTNKRIQQRAETVVTLMRESPKKPLPEKVHSKAKAALRSLDMNVPFEAHKRQFFMLDLFPEVAEELTGITLPTE